MDLEGSLPYSQKLPTGPCREPKEPRHKRSPKLVKIHFSKLLLFRPNHFKFSVPYSFLNRNVSGFLACYLKSAHNVSPQQAVFHSLLSLSAFGLHLFSSTAYSATPAVRFLPLRRQTESPNRCNLDNNSA